MSDASDRPPRVLLAIGNPERERQLLTALREGGWTVAGRCLDGPSLLQQVVAGECRCRACVGRSAPADG